MGTVNQKYLKDENDNTLSPVTSVDSVYDRNGDNVGGVLYQLVPYFNS